MDGLLLTIDKWCINNSISALGTYVDIIDVHVESLFWISKQKDM